MNYQEALFKQIQIYKEDVLPAYHKTTVEGMRMAKKLRLFRKIDFMKYVEEFQGHKENALKLEAMELRIPDDLADLKALEQDFRRCLLSFVILCDANIVFYEFNEKKQYKNTGFEIKAYTEAVNNMKQALQEAVVDSDLLEHALLEYAKKHMEEQQ